MPRKPNPDLIKPWKVNLPATLAGKIEYLLYDPIHNRPRYASRGFLLESLLTVWLAKVENESSDLPKIVERFLVGSATEQDLRDSLNAHQSIFARMPTLDEVRNARS